MKSVKSFLARPAALAVTATALALIAAACSQSSNLTSPTAAVGGSTADQDDGRKGIICHAKGNGGFTGVDVGLQDTDEGTTLFTNNGHLDANGSKVKGHEQDFYLGPNPPFEKTDCPGASPTPTPTPTPTPGLP